MATFKERLGNAAAGTPGSKRMLIVVGGVAILAGVVYVMTASEPAPPPSEFRGPGTSMRTVQGQTPVSPEYDSALQAADRARVQEATQSGTSVIPTIRATEAMPIDRPDESGNRQGDLDGVNRPTPPVVAPPAVVSPVVPIAPPPIQVAQGPIEVDPMVEQMRRQLEGFKSAFPPAKVDFYSKGPAAPADLSGMQAQAAGGAVGSLIQTNGGIKIPLPGTIVYAELVSSANSDAPGPVVARIVQGDLAGATLVGSFQTQRDALVISFQTLSMGTNREGDEINKSIAISAVAVDSATIGTGMATSVDRHLLQNVGIAAAAAFAQGLGSAISQSGQQVTQSLGGVTVTNPLRSTRDQLYIAGGVAGGVAGQALQQAYGNRPVTIKVASGTPMGVLFLPNRNF